VAWLAQDNQLRSGIEDAIREALRWMGTRRMLRESARAMPAASLAMHG
jgi:hypothetical protein